MKHNEIYCVNKLCIWVAVLVLFWVTTASLHAEGDMTSQDPIDITIALGNKWGALRLGE